MQIGRLINIEGPDTAGKSTLIEKLKIALPIIYPNKKFIFTREPGNLIEDFNKSEDIRQKLLTDSSLSTMKQAELFAESRFYHTVDILKKIAEDYIVITDRYLLSSIIYQGSPLGFNTIIDLNKVSTNLLKSSNVEINNIVLQISEKTYNDRMSKKEKDALEDVAYDEVKDRILYYNTIRTLNHSLDNNLGNIYSVNANDTISDVFVEALNHIHTIIR